MMIPEIEQAATFQGLKDRREDIHWDHRPMAFQQSRDPFDGDGYIYELQ
jgi:hypothetical protein